MSFQSMSWAVSQKCGSAAAKMVLLTIAIHTDGNSHSCQLRHKLLAHECEMRVETIKVHLKHLESLGLVSITPQFFDFVQLANQYTLNVDGKGLS